VTVLVCFANYVRYLKNFRSSPAFDFFEITSAIHSNLGICNQRTNLTSPLHLQVLLYDTIIHMIRGSDPIVSKNPFAKPGTPKAVYRLNKAGLFLILKTKVGCWCYWNFCYLLL